MKDFCSSKMTFYAVLWASLREEAREHGYALTLHGSLQKDLDIVAIPWTDTAAEQEVLVKALCEKCGGMISNHGERLIHGEWVEEKQPFRAPHGRMVYTILLGGHDGGYIDLGVMPLFAR